jgi:hypothetical protein
MDPATAALLCTVQKALGVLCALLLLGHPAGVLDLALRLNCSHQTVEKHLDVLFRQELVRRDQYHNGYTVSEKGLFFWFDQCGKIYHVPSTTTAAIKDYLFKDRLTSSAEEVVDYGNVEKNAMSAKNGNDRPGADPQQEAQRDELDPERVAANLAAFREEGVGLNHRVLRACRLPHVSPDYIHAQANRLALEKRLAPALLLHIVESEDPYPSDKQLADPENRERYIRGEFAGYIEGVE